jgi:glutathione S-transferase
MLISVSYSPKRLKEGLAQMLSFPTSTMQKRVYKKNLESSPLTFEGIEPRAPNGHDGNRQVIVTQLWRCFVKIYGHPWSTNTRSVLLTIAEKKCPAELIPIVIPKGEHMQPEHVARHPFAKVPVLADDDFVLYETRAILGYIDRTRPGTSLTPSSAKQAARMEQWLNILDFYLLPSFRPLMMEGLFRPFLGGEVDHEAIKAGQLGIQPALEQADKWLSFNNYLAGESFSLADIYWMPCLEYVIHTNNEDSINSRKHLHRWWQEVSARSTWEQVARTGPQAYEPL